MIKTQRRLMVLFMAFLLVAAALYVCGEFAKVDMCFLADANRQQRFVCSTLMILLTIGLLPLSLRLFRFKAINADLLSRKAPALLRWGSIRLVVMGLLLVVNTFLYFAFGFEATYGYLAVVALLCMPFVVPTKESCLAEVSEEKPADENITDTPDEEANDSHSQL